MTAANAKDYLPSVEALRDGELEERFAHGWEFVIHADFAKPPEDYRRRPKHREWWLGLKPSGAVGVYAHVPIGAAVDFKEIIHVREVTNE